MPLVLLLLGIVTALAGVALGASGVNLRDGTFDIEATTPGVVAAVGGLLLIGMGLAVRELQRIERALAARPMPRTTRSGDMPVAAAPPETPEAGVRIPFPAKPTSNPTPSIAG